MGFAIKLNTASGKASFPERYTPVALESLSVKETRIVAYLQAFFPRVFAPCGFRSFRQHKFEMNEWNLIHEQMNE